MTNRAPGLAFPDVPLLQAERRFIMQLENRSQAEGYVRRIDFNLEESFAYTKIRIGPRMSHGKGNIYYACAYIRNPQGNYRIHSRNPMVIKKLSKNWLHNHPQESVMNEIYIANEHGDDVHIAKTHETLEDERYYYIIMPLLGIDLIDCLQLGINLCYPTITHRLIQNLCHLKDLGILHCDISAENVIYSDIHGQIECPLIDFAMARKCATDVNGQFLQVIRENPPRPLGKLQYMSPEIYNVHDLHFGVDMWAVGCLLFYLWTGNFLYQAPGDACWNYFVLGLDQLPRHRSVTKVLTLWDQLSHTKQNLLTRIFHVQPDARAKPEELLNHPYVIN